MSTATEISRILGARNTIRDKLINLGLATSTDKIDDLAEEIGDTLYLWERMKLESPYQLDSTSYFYLCYKDSIGQNNQKILESDKDSIVIDETTLNNGIIQNGIYVSLRYSNTRMKEDCAVKDSLFIYIIPDNY